MALDSLSALSKINYSAQAGGVVVLSKPLTTVFNTEYLTNLVGSAGSTDLCHQKPNSAYQSRGIPAQGTTCLPLIEPGHFGGILKPHTAGEIGGREGTSEFRTRTAEALVSKHGLDSPSSRPSSAADTSVFTLCEVPVALTSPVKPSSATTAETRTSKSADRKKKVKGKKSTSRMKLKNSKNSHTDSKMTSPGDQSALNLTFTSLTGGLTANCKAVKLYHQEKKKPRMTIVQETQPASRKHSKPSDQGKVSKLSKSLSLSNSNVSVYMTSVRPAQKSRQSMTQSSSSSPRPGQQLLNRMLSQADEVVKKLTKVYLSDKNSGVLKECGMQFPCAPPATPTPEQLKQIEYVPSLADIRAKRAIRQRLEVMEKKAQSKADQERADQVKVEKQKRKDEDIALKRKQRLQIYALNKVMTDLEHQRFQEFCRGKNIL